MRFSRIILATLAPLLSVSAGMSSFAGPLSGAAIPGERVVGEHRFLAGLLRTVVHCVLADADEPSVSISSEHRSPRSLLALSALASTPFGHSLWMLSRGTALTHSPASHQPAFGYRLPLRC